MAPLVDSLNPVKDTTYDDQLQKIKDNIFVRIMQRLKILRMFNF